MTKVMGKQYKGKKEKAREALNSSGTITFVEHTKALLGFGYTLDNLPSGSRIAFRRARADGSVHRIRLHKPHPGNEVKAYAKRQVLESLKREGLL